MKVFCYMRFPRREEQTLQKQAEEVKESAMQAGFDIVQTRSAAMDVKLLTMLQQNKAVLNGAVVEFRE